MQEEILTLFCVAATLCDLCGHLPPGPGGSPLVRVERRQRELQLDELAPGERVGDHGRAAEVGQALRPWRKKKKREREREDDFEKQDAVAS